MSTPLTNPLTPLHMISNKLRNTESQTSSDLRHLVRSLLTIKSEPSTTKQQAIAFLKESQTQLRSLKRELSSSLKEQSQLYQSTRKRLHIQQTGVAQRQEQELQRQIMQYALCRQEIKKAEQFQKALGETQFNPEIELYFTFFAIQSQTLNNNLRPLRNWTKEHSHALAKIDNPLLFSLLCCQYLTFININQQLAACHCLRQGLSNLKLSSSQKQQVKKLTFMLIDPRKITKEVIKSHLNNTVKYLQQAMSQIYHITFQPTLSRRLALGISALTTVCCCSENKRNPQVCPVCTDNARILASGIPILPRQSSCLICKVTGKTMNHQNYPVVLPSKYIYSIQALRNNEKNDMYYCTMTQTYYPKEEARKVFLA